jgi:hypothetical protein
MLHVTLDAIFKFKFKVCANWNLDPDRCLNEALATCIAFRWHRTKLLAGPGYGIDHVESVFNGQRARDSRSAKLAAPFKHAVRPHLSSSFQLYYSTPCRKQAD